MALRTKIVKQYCLQILLFTSLYGCKTENCEEATSRNSNLELRIIVKEVNWNGNLLNLDGISIENGKSISFNNGSDWYYAIGGKIQVGDTLIKKKGEPIMRLYRKGERWLFTYICEKDSQGNIIVRSKDVKF